VDLPISSTIEVGAHHAPASIQRVRVPLPAIRLDDHEHVSMARLPKVSQFTDQTPHRVAQSTHFPAQRVPDALDVPIQAVRIVSVACVASFSAAIRKTLRSSSAASGRGAG
jgi:hypothetical protein